MSPDLERLIEHAKDVLQQISEHPEAEVVRDLLKIKIDEFTILERYIEEDLEDKQEMVSGFVPLKPITVYPILPTQFA